MEKIMEKMVEKRNGTSLLELGFVSAGLDDNWQACGTGYNKTFHGECTDVSNHINLAKILRLMAMLMAS